MERKPQVDQHIFWHLEDQKSKTVFVETLFHKDSLQNIIDVSLNRKFLNNWQYKSILPT